MTDPARTTTPSLLDVTLGRTSEGEEYVKLRGDAEYSQEHLPVVDAERAIDELTAIQLAIWGITAALNPFTIALKKLLSGTLESKPFHVKKIFFDWPEYKDEHVEVPSICIKQKHGAAVSYDPAGLEMDGDQEEEEEDTIDRFAPGTVLFKQAEAQASMELVVWFGSKEERAGFRKALTDSMLGEPRDTRPGRRVIVRDYYERVCRMVLEDIDYPDSGESALANTWILTASLTCDIDVVKLVKREALTRAPRVGVDLT